MNTATAESELPDEIDVLKRIVIEQRARIEALTLFIAKLRRMQFGRSSERIGEEIAQLELALEELQTEAALSERVMPQAAPEERAPRVRKPLPDHLPREQAIHPAAEGSCDCPACGAALRQLGGQQPPKVFRLSNGAVCDVAAQRCWSDGWDRRTIDTTLSRQLFGQGGGAVARQAQCRLTRWFKTLASGSCEIRERTSARGRKVDVALTDGSVYTFSNFRGEGYRITDGQGATWPVRVSEQGNNLSFSWSDRVLQVTLERTSSSQSLIQLLNTLLGN